MKELIEIQHKLKAPKGQYNSFGKYKYRSAEDILEAVKPLLYEQKVMLTLSDDVEHIGDRYYIKATATIRNAEGETVTTFGKAQEAADKKGMDESQITGTASSYARKYALNGLFLIDDTKDADTDEYARQNAVKPQPQPKPYNVDYAATLKACSSIADLQRVWGAIPKEVKPDYLGVKEEMKNALVKN